MPVDIPDPTAAVTASVASPIAPITASMNQMDAASKKVAELGLKDKKKIEKVEEDDTDNDKCYLFDIAKVAIENGAKVVDIDLKALIPAFQEETKTRAKKYQAQKVVGFFTGSGFMFMIYMLFEYLKTLNLG